MLDLLDNLIDNSVRYGGRGSTVTVADPTVLMGTSDSTLQATVNVVTAGVAPHASPASPVQAAIGDLKTYGIAPQTAQQTMTWTQVPATLTANPLPQALILTAIVISFSFFAFLLVLVYRAYQDLGTDNGNEMRLAEPEDEPLPPTGY